jgi:ATP-dependent Zn protease
MTAEKDDLMMSKPKIAMICAVLMCAAGVFWLATASQRSLINLTYSQFLQEVRTGQVASVIVVGSNSGAVQATCKLKEGKTVRTVLPSDYKDALVAMQDKLVNIEIRDSSSEPLRLFMNATPFLLLLGVWVFLMIRKFPISPK